VFVLITVDGFDRSRKTCVNRNSFSDLTLLQKCLYVYVVIAIDSINSKV